MSNMTDFHLKKVDFVLEKAHLLLPRSRSFRCAKGSDKSDELRSKNGDF
jgi:hypothetical protein